MLPAEIFADLARRYPDIWKSLDTIRTSRGVVKDFPTWMDNCFMPLGIAAEYAKAMASTGARSLPEDAYRIAVLGGWRPAQDIYRFEPELFAALISTAIEKVPAHVLSRLPAWAIYVETPHVDWIAPNMAGFWAAIEDNTGRQKLLLVADYGSSNFIPLIVPLDQEDLQEGIFMGLSGILSQGGEIDKSTMRADKKWGQLMSAVTKMLSLLLYICSHDPDVRHTDGGQTWPPSVPMPKKVKTGWRLFAADKPTVWRVGDTIARQIRQATEAERGTHAGPRPHIRRAHWHGFWSGTIKPREGVEPTPRNFKLKWLAPTAVALGDDDDS